MEELAIAIRVTADGVAETIGEVEEELNKLKALADEAGGGKGDPFKPMKDGAEEAAAAQAVLATASAAAFAKITQAVQSGTDAYNAYTAATKGLESIATGKGIDNDALTRSLEEVTDGFFSATAAAQAYKNLLSRGYTLDQATTTIERLKDAAAFGRAANLSLEDAVVSATEGIRQENSVLVDNAGVTKNVAKMWEEYAKARGLTTASLTQSQKVEAEYLGILKETELQVGDLAKAADSLAGAQAENAATATELATAYGEALAPGMQWATERMTEFLASARDIVNLSPSLAAGLTAAAAAMAMYTAASKGMAAVQTLLAGGAKLLNPAMLGVSAVVGIAATAYTAYAKAQKEAAEQQAEAARAAEEERKAQAEKALEIETQVTELEELGKQYKELTILEERTASQEKQLKGIVETLITQYGISAEALDGLAGAYDSGNAAIADRIQLYYDEQRAILEKAKAEKQALLDVKAEEHNQNAREYAFMQTQHPWFSEEDFIETSGVFDVSEADRKLDEWISAVESRYPEMAGVAQEYRDMLYGALSLDEVKTASAEFFSDWGKELEASAGELTALKSEVDELNKGIETIADFDWEKLYGGKAETETGDGTAPTDDPGAKALQSAQDTVAAYNEILETSIELRDARENLTILQNEEAAAAEKHAAAIALQREGYGYLLGDVEAIAAAMQLTGEQADANLQAYYDQRAALEEQLALLEEAHDAGEISDSEYLVQSQEIYAALAQTMNGALAASKAMGDFTEETEDAEDELTKLEKSAEETGKKLEKAIDFRAEIRQMKDLAKQVKDSGGGWDDLSDEIKSFAKDMGVVEGDIDGAILAFENMEGQAGASVQAIVADIQGILSALEAMRAEMIAASGGTIDVDTSPAIQAITAVINMLYALLDLEAEAGVTPAATEKRGGGGGGRKADTSAEDAARAAERAQEEAYQAELERIEHRRHLGQITAQEEIAELERVKREYAKTAEQIMDIDERIYDARQALRDEEEEKIDSLYDSIVDALEARYEEQREIEQKRISDSIKAWEKWSDDTCAAIQKQIDALDEQAEAEDRAATEAEHLRKIASLEQALTYETDAYNQAQLIKQIKQAQEAWAEVQKGWAVEDQREALEEQKQAIQDRADAEIGVLEEEAARIDSVYDEMLKGQSLAAEAQKLLMQSTQEDLLSLLSSYAPDYEATGRTLGEKIYEGFKSAFGDISAFFAQIDAQFEQMTQNAAEAAFGRTQGYQASGQATANVASAPVITQTVNFNQPVDSPADVARRMQQVSEELAGMI